MKNQLVFKLEKEPAGFSQVLSSDCKVEIEKTEGLLYLNYEHRVERVVGSYKNLRQEGELILADVELKDEMKSLESRFEYSIEGSVLKKNEAGEAERIKVKGVGAQMPKEPTRFKRILQVIVNSFKEHIYYTVDSFVSRTYERASRSLAFAKHGWMHYDFESAYLYDLMAFKMKRIYACLETGHAIQDDEDMQALKEAIEICERLFKGEYDDKYYKAHAEKWGKMKSDHIPEYNEDGTVKWYRWETSRPNAKTAAQEKREVADLRKIWKNEEKDRRADLKRLHEILVKHEPTWWD